MPALLVVAIVVVMLSSAEGGYFPTSWGWSALLLLWALGLWLVLAARTDAGALDLAFLGLLAVYTGWVALSTVWSAVPAASAQELLRSLVPLTAVTALLCLARRKDVGALLLVLLAAVTVVCAYALATRLLPDRLGEYDDIATYRLAAPLGYWNGLGIFAAIGLLVAFGVVADAKERVSRAGAGAAVVVLATTLYFTYSRGAWLALALGAVVLLLLTSRRLWTAAVCVVVGAPAALSVLVASRSDALTHENVPLEQAAAAGHRVGVIVVLLAAAAAAATVALGAVERVKVSPLLRIGFAAGLVAITLAALAVVSVQHGNPAYAVRDAWRAFEAPPPVVEEDLNQRLFSLSGNGRVELWRLAGEMYADRPIAGAGAGTFERFWQHFPDASHKVRDAHSLYVETLAELGTVGLVLLLGVLLLPFRGALAARRLPVVPAVAAAYAAFVLHLGVDWDWELSAVTVTGLFTGCILVVASRRRPAQTLSTPARIAGSAAVVVAGVVAGVGLLGNAALDHARSAVDDGRFANAVDDAHRAHRLMPWSPWPWIALGDAYLSHGESAAAGASYREAIAVDDGEWRAWLGLALASDGRARARAVARARTLYPRSSEIATALEKS